MMLGFDHAAFEGKRTSLFRSASLFDLSLRAVFICIYYVTILCCSHILSGQWLEVRDEIKRKAYVNARQRVKLRLLFGIMLMIVMKRISKIIWENSN